MTMNRLEGRLFAESGTLFMVVHADEAENKAQVSFRVNNQTQLIDLPFSEASARVANGSSLILDNMNSPQAARRLLEMEDGWYFAAREGQMGPYESKEQAGQELGKYILTMQSEKITSREPDESPSAMRAAYH